MSQPFIGEIRAFGFHFAPSGWAFCDGQLLAIAQYTALFSILGTTYGGNGQSTFGLPNLQGAAAMHWGTSPYGTVYDIGETIGTDNVTVLLNQMPNHNHLVTTYDTTAVNQRTGTPSPTVYPGNANPGNVYATTGTPNASLSAKTIGIGGGSLPHANVQPLLANNFCIALVGIFPARN
jgi:microcystin-dependent protein